MICIQKTSFEIDSSPRDLSISELIVLRRTVVLAQGTLHLWGLPKTSMDDTRLSLSASLNDTLTYNESGKNKKSRMSVTNIFNIASSNRVSAIYNTSYLSMPVYKINMY